MARGGKNSPRAGYYLHIEPDNCLLCGGIWCPDPPLLKALRQSIYDNCDEFREILEEPAFKKLYHGLDNERALKVMPRPFPKDFPLKTTTGCTGQPKNYLFYTRSTDF